MSRNGLHCVAFKMTSDDCALLFPFAHQNSCLVTVSCIVLLSACVSQTVGMVTQQSTSVLQAAACFFGGRAFCPENDTDDFVKHVAPCRIPSREIWNFH